MATDALGDIARNRASSVWLVAVLVCLAACRPLSGATPSPAPSPTPTSVPTPAPTPAPTPSNAAPLSSCAFVLDAEIASATGSSTAFAASESAPGICVFNVTSDHPYQLVVRAEDSFADTDSVGSVFPDARDIELGDARGVWVPTVTTLWVPSEHSGLLAVQFLNFEDANGDPEQLASAIGALLTTR